MPLVRQLAFAALAALATVASAQPIYRIVGPDGRVTFSDKPPAEPSARAKASAVVPMTAADSAGGASLPFALRQAANRYPVTLYSGPECQPCESARTYLSGRGVPFGEKTVSTSQDIEALRRLSGSPALPFLTIGGQQLKGYSEPEWGQFLDAAGYPRASQLPVGYRRAAATPLVAAQEPARPAAAATPAPRSAAAAAPGRPAVSGGPVADNPAGIRF